MSSESWLRATAYMARGRVPASRKRDPTKNSEGDSVNTYMHDWFRWLFSKKELSYSSRSSSGGGSN